ncbi:LysE family translocator [Pikeienuella piscinae]|uniref:LysE family translocator n=2 Tax=Pikeienuella piscinae TaxID=2748098 RepID=A0A7M3T6S9_9RHOB|nr:LysE family translocator [Pikeienuella piscinae]
MLILPDAAVLATFFAASLALNFTPGADMMFAVASGASGGPRAAVAAAFGINLGVVAHISLAALGLAALIAANPLAYDFIRFAGAAYLVWLAIQTWRAPPPAPGAARRAPVGRVALRGFATNILNPKTALFIFAFLPQFADPARGPVWAQIVALGGIFIATGFTVNAVVGALAGAATGRLLRASRLMSRVSALVFGGLAARLVID